MTKLTARWVEGEPPEDCVNWIGGDHSNPTWDEYIDGLDPDRLEIVEALREAHERDSLDIYGQDMNTGYFLLSDGRSAAPSCRAWGDLRQAMVGKREGYMRYYIR